MGNNNTSCKIQNFGRMIIPAKTKLESFPDKQNKKDRHKTCLFNLSHQKICAPRAYCCRLPIKHRKRILLVFLDDCHSLALAFSPTGCARARPFRAEITAKAKLESFPAKTKKTGTRPVFLFWRRREDLNFRAGYPTYTLSRGASSAT